MGKSKSKKPTGKTLVRSRGRFGFGWKRGENYKEQKLERKIKVKGKKASWVNVPVGDNAKDKTITIDPDNYFPLKNKYLSSVSFHVKGKAKNETYSDWSKAKSLTIKPPIKPQVGYAQESAYATRFVVEANRFINNRGYWGTHIEYESALVIGEDCKIDTDVKKWGTRTRKKIYDSIYQKDITSFDKLITETPADIIEINKAISKGQSAVRWFRGRVSGPGGPSKWVAKHIAYSESKPVYNVSSKIVDNDTRGYTCTVDWWYIHSVSFPIDAMKVQYAFAIPDKDLKPIELNVQEAIIGGNNTIVPDPKKTKETGVHISTTFEIPEKTDLDQMIFVRVNVEHNGVPTYGDWVYCRDMSDGIPNSDVMLRPPTINSITPTVDNKVSVTVTNNSEVNGVFIVLKFVGDKGAEYSKDIGVINTNNQTGEFTKTVEIPPDYDGNYQIVAYAAVDRNLNDYYTLTATAVDNPTNDDIEKYYEKNESTDPVSYFITEDPYLKKYYTVSATSVRTPVQRLINTYYELSNGIYIRTEDETIVSGKTYYTLQGTLVENPVLSSISSYYEEDDSVLDDDDEPIADMYVHTEDVILYGKTYYTVVGNKVLDPLIDDIGLYYIKKKDSIREDPVYFLTTDKILYGTNAERKTIGSLGYYVYTITALMKSAIYMTNIDVMLPPSHDDISLDRMPDGNVRISWNWNWEDIDAAEIAWSDYKEAMNSTEPPSSYTVSNSQYNNLVVKGLDLGVTWYFWVRFIKGGTVSIWSDVKAISLTSEPNIPVLELSKKFITLDDKFTANWTYVTTDYSEQKSAVLCLCDVDENGKVTPLEESPIGEVTGSSQYYTFDPKDEKLNWETGKSYNIVVRVTSESNLTSEDWSNYQTVTVVEPVSCSISQSGLVPAATDYDPESQYSVGDYAFKIVEDPDNEKQKTRVLMKCTNAISEGGEEWNEEHWMEDENYPCQELQELSKDNPLSVTISSDGNDIVSSSIFIVRSEDYFIDRPDNGTYGGYSGEVICQITDTESPGEIEIEIDDIYGNLDDDAQYYLIVSVTDTYEQSSTEAYPFVVKWTHQAVKPIASVVIDDVAKISITAPTGSAEGDYCDIYRMSSDGIDLIYSEAEFGQTYVDPYPTIGNTGGYRVVYRTYNGDYIDSAGEFAWLNFLPQDGYIFDSVSNLIDFNDNTLEIKYNVDIDNSWKKDFQTTKYLGGSIQGDYNYGVERTGSLSSDIQTNDTETIRLIKELATYEGLCHVRTKDGSNYLANVEVSENIPYQPYYDKDGNFTKLGSYSFSITRVDPQEEDGMTLAEWQDDQPT